MDTKQLIREDVTRGAAWLDRVAPGWAYTLQLRAGRDLEGVDMFDAQRCIAGHVFADQATDDGGGYFDGGGFQVAASKMDSDPLVQSWPEPLIDHGFIVRYTRQEDRNTRQAWAIAAWREAAHDRLNVWQRFRVWLADIRRNQVESF